MELVEEMFKGRSPNNMDLNRTHLYPFHKEHGHLAKFSDFEMPMWYEGITPEHHAVREGVGIFDVTHMGRSLISGEDAGRFLDYVTTRNISSLPHLRGFYSVMCNERGGVVDDLMVFRLDEERFLTVYNATNREKDYRWLVSRRRGFDATVEDISDRTPMFALQGPKAAPVLKKLTSTNIEGLKRNRARWLDLMACRVLATRSGYTGEDGYEIYLWDTPLSRPGNALRLWGELLKGGEPFRIKACGLGARDTLRLEAGYNLYGNELDEDTTPLEAGLDFAVKLDGGDFIGREALLEQKKDGVSKRRVALKMIQRGVPRHGCRVYRDEERVGTLTSGTFSPLLKCGVALGYLTPEEAVVGQVLKVKIRSSLLLTKTVETPFYDTKKYGLKRERA